MQGNTRSYLQGILGKMCTLPPANERFFQGTIVSQSELQQALCGRPNTHIWTVPCKY